MEQNIQLAVSIMTLLAMIFAIYKFFRDPDIKAENSLNVLKTSCVLKHSRLDEIVKEIKEAIVGINYTFAHFKENEFRHIEEEMRKLSDTQTQILTILDERNKK